MLDAIYIHIPFCVSKCNYCDFTSFASDEREREIYVENLIEEIKMYPKHRYDTVYFGGGTPSLLKATEIEKILSYLDIEKDSELTLEVNPKTVDYEKLVAYKKIGINRLSIGIQSFNKKYLNIMGRVHSVEDAVSTYLDARRAGFDNISLDLIFSLPGQSLEEVEDDLNKLIALRPEHFSIYSLIWEEGTEFYKKLKKGILKETDNDLETEMYEKIIEVSEKNGYEHYEISNFSLPNMEAKHNSKYWENKEYLGVGLGAAGYISDLRYKNEGDFTNYYGKIASNNKPILEEEIVDSLTKEEYRYILGLRLLRKGIKVSPEFLEICEKLIREDYLKSEEGNLLLTRKGLLLFNDVVSQFI